MYFRSIQLVRFIAALCIMLYHVNHWWNYQQDSFSGLFNNANGAIDLFFVISGFVVVQSAATFTAGWDAFKLFLKKRFIRIFPVYWLFLLFFLITEMVSVADKTWLQCLRAVLLLPNHQGIIRTTWTMQWELYFYFLIGLTVLHKLGRYLVLGLVILSLVANSGVLLGFINTRFLPVQGLYNELVLEFFLGVVVWKVFKKVPPVMAILMVVMGAAFLLMPILIKSSHLIAFGLPAALLITGLTALEWRKKIVMPDWVVLLGNSSYCLYLIHLPIIETLLGNLDIAYSSNKWLILLLVIAIAFVSVPVHLLIESPILKYLNRKKQKDAVAVVPG